MVPFSANTEALSRILCLPEDVSEPLAICIGWDVGGWHGRKDGIGAVALFGDGAIRRVGRARLWRLGPAIASHTLGIDDLLAMAGLLRDKPWSRMVLGVDAPLGLPQAFVESTAARISDNVSRRGRLASEVVENRLAYRDTERAVCAAYRTRQKRGWRPLSPSFDGMGSNISKARSALSTLRTFYREEFRVIPFDADSTRMVALEVYPALWNALREDEMDPSVAAALESARSESSPDVRDAVLCALAAACYERTRLGMTGRPAIMLPPDGTQVAFEGWIYAPRISPADG